MSFFKYGGKHTLLTYVAGTAFFQLCPVIFFFDINGSLSFFSFYSFSSLKYIPRIIKL